MFLACFRPFFAQVQISLLKPSLKELEAIHPLSLHLRLRFEHFRVILKSLHLSLGLIYTWLALSASVANALNRHGLHFHFKLLRQVSGDVMWFLSVLAKHLYHANVRRVSKDHLMDLHPLSPVNLSRASALFLLAAASLDL